MKLVLAALLLSFAYVLCLELSSIKFKKLVANTAISASLLLPGSCIASSEQVYVYKSGKAPYLQSDSRALDSKDDKYSGSKKDSSFLRALSSCKTKCQSPSEGLAKNDCVQDCQDQTCSSYEQCSFRIKASMGGNAI